MKKKVLFVCIHNSARSQMAEVSNIASGPVGKLSSGSSLRIAD